MNDRRDPAIPNRGADRWLLFFLRGIGAITLLAFAAAVMPRNWIVEISEELGFAPFPESPLTFYLARNLSLLYGFVGATLWVIASDLQRYRPLVRYVWMGTLLFGLLQLVVDVISGMPSWWFLGESLSTFGGGLLFAWLDRRGRTCFLMEYSEMNRWVARLVSIRWFAALIGIALLALAAGPSRRMTLDRNITAMFAADDPALVDYRALQRDFGGNAVVLLVYRDDGLLTPAGLERNEAVSRRVSAVDGVRGVLSPARLNQVLATIRPGSGALTGDAEGGAVDQPALLRDDPIASRFERLFAGYTHSRSGRSGAVVAMLDPDHDRSTIDALRQVANDLPPSVGSADLVGEPVLLHDGFDLIERDGATLATWTIVLLGAVLLVTLRHVRFVVLAVAVIAWADTMTRATMVWMDVGLSLVSTILVAVVAVIAVAAVLHLGVRWMVARRRDYNRRAATTIAIALLAAPVFWTCATDAAGFAALGVSEIVPVRQFGWMIATAALFILAALVLFAPLLLVVDSRIGGREVDRAQAMRGRVERTLHRGCLRLAHGSVRWRQMVLPIAIGLAVISAWQTSGMVTETSFLNNFRPESSMVTAYARVEREFGGAGVWDVVLDAPRDLSAEYLDHVRALEEDLRAIDAGGARLTKVLSLADAEAIAADIPLLALVSPGVRLSGMRAAMPVFSDALLTPVAEGESARRMRIMLRSAEQLPAEQKGALISEVRSVVAASTESPEFAALVAERGVNADTNTDAGQGRAGVSSGMPRARVTGYYVMMAGLVSQLLTDQWRCFLVAIAAVWALLVLATRSFRLATAALAPNLLPVFVVLAVSGWLGGKLNMGAAMIAAVSIGLTIDGSVHFLAAYGRHRRRGHQREVAAVHAAGRIGLPIVLATLALVAGFGVIASSEFIPTATFGQLVAASLAVGTVVNLSVLPAAVAWIDRCD